MIDAGQEALEKWSRRLQWLLPLFGVSLATFTLLDRLGLGTPGTSPRVGIMAEAAAGLVQLASLVACVLVSSLWLARANANLAARGVALRYSPRGTWAWYFVPVANLFKPFGAMSEIWRESLAASGSDEGVNASLPTQWWAAWIVGNIALSFAAQTDLIGGRNVATALDAVGVIALTVAGALFARIVTTVTRAQRGLTMSATFA